MKLTYVEGDPRDLTLLEVNARFMRHEQYQQLVSNLRRDGVLSSAPLVWLDPSSGKRIVLSGNHRTRASIEAGLATIGWLETDEELTRDQQIALQLSHNAIAGEDDPAVLKRLYEEVDSLDWKAYAGLDDRTLELLADLDGGSLSEANLTFQSLSITYLPEVLEEAKAVVEEAMVLAKGADEKWVARFSEWDETMRAIDVAQKSADVKNVATGLALVLDVFRDHVEDLQDHWLDRGTWQVRHKGYVPIETLFGTDTMPAEAAAVVAQALSTMVSRGDLEQRSLWLALERWAADYLAGA